ncbi:hypothetical protein ACFC00_07250 [Streptomyces adustus]|uniref:hypothetical protein n=1 Tax=Streptomyces adustus TaxID=1609272 RepID=UPI0035DAA809
MSDWPVYRQLIGSDPLGRGQAAVSPRTRQLEPRTDTADRVVPSSCPYCAVGCGRQIYAPASERELPAAWADASKPGLRDALAH